MMLVKGIEVNKVQIAAVLVYFLALSSKNTDEYVCVYVLVHIKICMFKFPTCICW